MVKIHYDNKRFYEYHLKFKLSLLGYFVCPWCNQDGTWEKLMLLLNSREDCLSTEQLNNYLATTLPVSEVGELALKESPLQVRIIKSEF